MDTARSFTISDDFFDIVKRYRLLQPPNMSCTRFFIGYRHGRCIRQPIDYSKFSDYPPEIAEYLHLENPRSYKGKVLYPIVPFTQDNYSLIL